MIAGIYARTWFLSRALENWLIEGGTFSRWYRICFVGVAVIEGWRGSVVSVCM